VGTVVIHVGPHFAPLIGAAGCFGWVCMRVWGLAVGHGVGLEPSGVSVCVKGMGWWWNQTRVVWQIEHLGPTPT